MAGHTVIKKMINDVAQCKAHLLLPPQSRYNSMGYFLSCEITSAVTQRVFNKFTLNDPNYTDYLSFFGYCFSFLISRSKLPESNQINEIQKQLLFLLV